MQNMYEVYMFCMFNAICNQKKTQVKSITWVRFVAEAVRF